MKHDRRFESAQRRREDEVPSPVRTSIIVFDLRASRVTCVAHACTQRALGNFLLRLVRWIKGFSPVYIVYCTPSRDWPRSRGNEGRQRMVRDAGERGPSAIEGRSYSFSTSELCFIVVALRRVNSVLYVCSEREREGVVWRERLKRRSCIDRIAITRINDLSNCNECKG